MLDFVIGKLAAIPWYFWFLVFVWGVIEAAGWLRVRNSRKRRLTRSRGDRSATGNEGVGVRFARWGLRRRVY